MTDWFPSSRRSGHCSPTKRERRGDKPQIPSSKLQRNTKHQTSSEPTCGDGSFGAWILEILWNLDVGAWNLSPVTRHTTLVTLLVRECKAARAAGLSSRA